MSPAPKPAAKPAAKAPAAAPAAKAPAMPPCDHKPRPYKGPSQPEVLAARRKWNNPGLFMYYKDPLMIVEGKGQWLWDEKGKRYLDLFAGVATVSCGHSHPKILKALKDQVELLQHTTTIYMHPSLSQYAEKLASKLPPGLDCVYCLNSGSEANEVAMMMARLYTGNRDIIALRNCYHGGTNATMGLTSHSSWKFNVPQGNDVHHAMAPDPYRSPYKGTAEEIAAQSAEDIRQVILYETTGKIAGFIAEPVQGVGGLTFGHKSYYQKAAEIVKAHGGLYISDEVQTGFCRTGENFWGFQNYGITPDIVTMAKGIGSGFPLSCVVTRKEIAETVKQKIHFSTYGGNPMAMAVGLAVLDVLEEDKLQENAKVVGLHFKKGLEKLQAKHKVVGDVRGQGLMIGVELVKDRTTKEPNKEAVLEVMEICKEHGIIIGRGGLFANILRVQPPLCLSKADVDYALAVLDVAFGKVS